MTEAQGEGGDQFGEGCLLASVLAAAPLGAEGVKARLLEDVRTSCGDEFDDDATILVLGID